MGMLLAIILYNTEPYLKAKQNILRKTLYDKK